MPEAAAVEDQEQEQEQEQDSIRDAIDAALKTEGDDEEGKTEDEGFDITNADFTGDSGAAADDSGDVPGTEAAAKDAPALLPASTIDAPYGWPVDQKESWAAIPETVQKRITERESEVGRILSQNAEQRKVADSFNDLVNPYAAMFQARGYATPLDGIKDSLASMAQLSMGDTQQRAKAVVDMIRTHQVDINAIADIIEGSAPKDGGINAALDERLAPINQYIAKQEQRQQQQTQNIVQNDLQFFAAQPENAFYQDLRLDMGALMSGATQQGRVMSLRQAYDMAMVSRPDVQVRATAHATTQAAPTNGAALTKAEIRRKQAASSSISSNSQPAAAGAAVDIRDSINAAWDDAGSG